MSLVHHTDDSPTGCALAAVVLCALWGGGVWGVLWLMGAT